MVTVLLTFVLKHLTVTDMVGVQKANSQNVASACTVSCLFETDVNWIPDISVNILVFAE